MALEGDAPTRKDGLWVPSRRAMTVGLILLVTLVAFEALAVNTALPAASRELGGIGLYGWVFAAFMLAMVASIAVSGRAIDERGLYPVLLVGAPLFCAGLVACALAPSMPILVAGRGVQGLGAGAISSVANTAIGKAYPPRLRAAMLAVMSSAWVVPGLVGPGLSALVTDALGWRFVFAGLVPLVALAAVLTLPALRPFGPTEDSVAHAATRRTADPLRVAAGFAFVIGGLSNAHDRWPLALCAVGFAIAAPALYRLTPRGTFRLERGAPAAIALNAVINFSFFSVDAFVPLAVTAVRHRAVGIAGLALTTGALSWTAGAWVTARLNQRIATRTRVRVGFLCVAAGNALVLIGLGDSVSIWIYPAAWTVSGLGMGLGYQGLALVVLGGDRTEGAEDDGGPAGATVAARQVFDVLGTATGTGVAGAIVAIAAAGGHSTKGGLTVTFAVMIAVALFGSIAAPRAQANPASPQALGEDLPSRSGTEPPH
ncbi:MAG TPA: MFS transporter [Acidimicrobiales bacterium]|nr:MFS transporter [Acidimicrobiales bacterium]